MNADWNKSGDGKVMLFCMSNKNLRDVVLIQYRAPHGPSPVCFNISSNAGLFFFFKNSRLQLTPTMQIMESKANYLVRGETILSPRLHIFAVSIIFFLFLRFLCERMFFFSFSFAFCLSSSRDPMLYIGSRNTLLNSRRCACSPAANSARQEVHTKASANTSSGGNKRMCTIRPSTLRLRLRFKSLSTPLE